MSGRLFAHRCIVSRMTAVGTNGRRQVQQVAQAVPSRFIPMPSRAEIENGFQVGTGYDVYVPSSAFEIAPGDQLTWSGRTFNVRAVAAYDEGRLSHRHVLATREGQ